MCALQQNLPPAVSSANEAFIKVTSKPDGLHRLGMSSIGARAYRYTIVHSRSKFTFILWPLVKLLVTHTAGTVSSRSSGQL